MKTKKTIAIDIDDVTADSTESLRMLVNKRFGADLTKQHYRVKNGHRRYYEHVWSLNGLDQVTYADLEDEMEVDQSHVPIMAGAQQAIKRLQTKYNVIFITSRYPSWENATRQWFKKHFGEDIELHFAEGYGNGQTKTKGQLCKEFGAEWLIDDVPGNCKTALDEGVKAILFGEYGWHIDVPNQVIQCKDWKAVEELLLGD